MYMDPIYRLNPSYDDIILSKKSSLYRRKHAVYKVDATCKGCCTRRTQLVLGVVQVDANRKNVPKIRYKFDQ